MASIFVSDLLSYDGKNERTAEIFFPDHKLCVRAKIDIDHDKGTKCLQVILSGIDSKDGKVYRGVHAARFLKYVAMSLSGNDNEKHHLSLVAQNYIMIYKGTNKINFNLSAPVDEWPEI